MSRDGITAIIPVRLGAPRKSRLSGVLSSIERERLADQLFAHVTNIVSNHPDVAGTIVLSPVQPRSDDFSWRSDSGQGLNLELEALRAALRADDLLIVHADLPLLTAEDVTAMIDAARLTGVAIAPDHLETGTNAVAVHKDRRFPFAFGSGSLAAHIAAADVSSALVRRIGLALDIDRPEDLVLAEREGFVRDR